MNINYHNCTIFVKNSCGNIAFTTDLFMGNELNKLVFILPSSAGVRYRDRCKIGYSFHIEFSFERFLLTKHFGTFGKSQRDFLVLL